MNILLDTCAISELRKPEPSPAFLDWFNSCNERLLHLSTITLGELRFGIDRLSNGRRKNDLLTWYAELCLSYRGHIIAPHRKSVSSGAPYEPNEGKPASPSRWPTV